MQPLLPLLRRKARQPVLALSLVALIASSGPASAADFYWDVDGTDVGNVVDGTNLGGTGTWNLGNTNWWPVPAGALTTWGNTSADHAIFTDAFPSLGIPTAHTVTLSGTLTANKLSFLRSGYTLTGGTLTLAGTTPTLHANLGESAIIESLIAGTGGLVKTGGGSIRLNNVANTYAGTTTISNGALVISNQSALGASTDAVVVNGSATRGFGGGSLVLDGGYVPGLVFTRDLVLQGYGPITDDSSALISIGNNTIFSSIQYATGNVATGIHSVGGVLTLSGSLSSVGTTGLLRFGVSNSAGVGSYHLTGVLNNSSTGGIEKTGAGTLILDPSAIVFNGTVNITGGSLRVSNGASLGTSTANGAITLGGGVGTLEVRTDSPASFSTRRVTMGGSGNATVFLDHAVGGQLLNQTIQFAPLTLTAGGTTRTLTINGRNGYGLTFVGDSVGGAIGGSNSITINANGPVTFDGNFWNNTATTARTLTMTVNTGSQATITGNLIASGAAHVLSKAGAGTLTILGNDSAYTGVTTISAGTLAISSFGSINNNAVGVNIGATTVVGTLDIIGNDLTIGQASTSKVINLAGTTGGATINANQTGTSPGLIFNANFTATGAGAKTLTLGGTNKADNTINGIIPENGGATSVIKTGSGTWVLAGSNNYAGATTITNGTLKLRASAAASDIIKEAGTNTMVFGVNTVTQTAGGTLEFTGVSGSATTETLGALTPTAGAGRVILVSGGGGFAANLTFTSLGATTAASSVNFDTSGAAGGVITLTGLAATTATTLPGTANFLGHLYINGADFAAINGSAQVFAPTYGTTTGFVNGGAALTAANHNLVNAAIASQAIVSVTSLKMTTHNLTMAGNLTLATGALLQTGGSATLDGTGGARLVLGGAAATNIAIRVNGESDVLTFGSSINIGSAQTGGLTKNGEGTLVFQATNAQTGTTTINEGTIELFGPSARLAALIGTATVIRQGASLEFNSGTAFADGPTVAALDGAGTISNIGAADVTFTQTGAGTFAGIFQETGVGVLNLTKAGTTGAPTWSGLSTYTGVTTIAGTTGLVSVSTLANIGFASGIGRGNDTDDDSNADSLVFAGTTGGLNYTGLTSVSIDRLFTLNGSTAGSGAQIANSSANNSALIFNKTNEIAFGAGATVAQTLTLGGASLGDNQINLRIRDNGLLATSVNKIGVGLWKLGAAANDYTGTTTITAGFLDAQDFSSLSNASGLILGSLTTFGVLETNGDFTRNVVVSGSAGVNTVSWNADLTTGGGGFSASSSKLRVALGGIGTETALVWGTGGFAVSTTPSAALVFNSTTSLAEVEFRNAIDLNGAVRTITVNDNTNTFTDYATITGDIYGTGGITKAGNGTLQLLGDNTYDGVTAVTAGTLVVESLGNSATPGASSVGDSTNGNTDVRAIVLGNATTTGGILQYIGAGEISDRKIRLQGTTASNQIHADGSGALILTNVAHDTIATGSKTLFLRGSNAMGNMITSDLTNNGAGVLSVSIDGGATWILTGNNSFTGTTTVGSAALGIGSNTAVGTGTLSLSNSSVFAYGGDRTLTNNVTLNTNAPFAFIGDYSLTLDPTSGLFTMTGTGTTSLTVTTTNNIAADKTLTLDGDVTSAAGAARSWAVNGSGNTTITGDIETTTAFTVALTYTGNGTLRLGGTNTTGGTTTISNAAGRVIIENGNAFGSGTLALTAGTLQSAGGALTITNNVTHGGTFILGGDDKLTFNGTWLNSAGSRTLTVNTTGGAELAGEVRLSEHATTARTLTINGTEDMLISGIISNGVGTGASALAYTGSGTLTLTNGANSYTGTTTLNNNAGTLLLTGAGKLSTGPLTVNAGNLLIQSVDQSVTTLTMGNVAGTSATINVATGLTLSATAITFSGTTTLASTITGAGTLALGASGITVSVADNVTQAADMIWSIANLTGSGTFTKTGTGTLDISGVTNNAFAGGYQIDAGAILGLNGATGNNLILNGGVYSGFGTFIRGLGTGNDQVQWLAGGGGFAALDGDLTVTLSGAPNPLVWGGTTNFVPDGAPLIFGSTAATDVVTFTHNIDLNGAARTVSAVDNTALTTDWAVLAGVLSNGGITKTGNGVLRLEGANTFTGAVTVTTGTLQFSTVSNNGGGPSNLGQGSNGISMGGGRLQFIGNTNQVTDRAMTFTATGILDASGTGGATITFNGAIAAADFSLNLEGSGTGILNSTMNHTGNAGDLNKNGSGTWTINTSLGIGDNVVISGGTLIFNAVNTFTGPNSDDLFIRNATLELGVNGALTSDVDDLNISTETAGGGIFDIKGTTGSSVTDIIIGLNPGNQGTAPALSGSMIDSLGGGSFSTATLTLRNGTISADLSTTGAAVLGNVISADHGGLNTTAGLISGDLTVGTTLTLWNGTISGNLTFGTTVAKHSSNTVTLSGNNTAGSGITTISNGVLVLDHSTNTGTKISGAGLTMNGGTLQIDGHASTPVTVSAGNLILGTVTDPGPAVVRINTAGAAATLEVGTITRNAGATLRFNPSTTSGHLTTTATNTAGSLLGGWATYQLGSGPADFATVIGGEILGFASTVESNVANWSASATITDGTGFTGSLVHSTRIHSLRFNAASGSSTVTIGSGDILDIASGGLLITNSVAAGNPTITGGRITVAGALNELIVTHDGSATFTLSSRMDASLALTKAGAGLMVLDHANNTSTGTVRVSGGTLRLQGGGAIGDRAAVIMEPTIGVLLDVVDSETIGSLSGGDASNVRNMAISIADSQTLTINQGAAGIFYGNINATSGSATLSKTGAGTLTINDGLINLGVGGVINVNTGRLTLDVNGNNAFVQSVASGTTVNVGAGASFFIDHNGVSTAAGIAGGRIGDDVAFNLNSTGSTVDGLFFRNDQNIALTEIIGAVTLGSGVNSVRVDATTTAANTTQNTILRASSITRSNQSTLVLRGIGIQATANPRAQFQNASVMAGFGTGTTTSLPVIPWAIGPAAGGTVAADSFLTTAGTANAAWRPLNLATEYALVSDDTTWGATTNTQNVLVNTTTSGAASSKTIRSLLVSTGAGIVNLTGDGAGSLTVDSGGFLFSGTGSSTLGGFTGIAVNPLVNEYVFHVMGSSATVGSQLTTPTAKLTKSGSGTLLLTVDNPDLGEITLNEGLVQVDSLAKLGSGDLRFFGGGIKLAPGYSGDLFANTWDVGTGGGVLDVGLVTGGFTLTGGIIDSTTSSDDVFTFITRATGSTGNDGLLTLQGASTFTGTTVFNHTGLNSGVINSVVLNGTTNQTILGNVIIGNIGAIPDNNFDVTVALGANEQIADTASITFNSASGEEAYFKLLGFTETVAGISAVSRGVIENHESAVDAVAGEGKLIVNSSDNFSFTGYLRNAASGSLGALAFEKQGSGTQTLVGANISYTGNTTISGGTLHLQGVTAWNSNIVNNSLLILDETAVRTHARDITGTGSLIKQGSAALTFAGGLALTYQGSTTVENGTMTVGSSINGTTSLRVLNSGSALALTGGITDASVITSIVVEDGGTLSLLDGTGNKLNSLTNLQLGSSGGTMTTLNLNVGDLSIAGDNLNTDLFTLLTGGTLSLFAGNQITFNLTDAGLNPGETYNLISTDDSDLLSILGSGDWLLGSTPGGFTSITLNKTNNLISITTGNLITGASYWTGLTDNTWNAGANNWSTDKAGTTPAASIPGQGTDVVFVANSHAGGALVTTLEQNFKINSLTFESSTNTPTSVTINSGTITTSRLEVAPQVSTDGIRITAGGPPAVTIAAPLKLGADQTWNIVDSGALLTISGGLQGEANVFKEGLGKVILSAVADPTFNTGLTTNVTINAGILEITNAGALGTTASSNPATVTINNSGVFYYNGAAGTVATNLILAGGALSAGTGNQIYSGDVNISGNSTINMADSNGPTGNTARNITLSGVVIGSGSLTIDSNSAVSSGNQIGGTTTISGAGGTWNGNLFVNRGTLTITSAASPTVTPGDVTFNSFGRLILQGEDGQTINRSGTLVYAANAVGEFQVDNVTGTQVTDFTVNQNGAVTLGSGGIGATMRITLADTLAKLNIVGGVTLGGNSSISVSNNAARLLTISGIIGDGGSGYGLAINDDAGTWAQTNGIVRLTGQNTFTGNISLDAGALEFTTVTNISAGASSLGNGTAISTTNAAILRFIGTSAQTTNRPITTAGGALTLSANGANVSDTITYAGTIAIGPTGDGSQLVLAGDTGRQGIISGGFTQTGTTADVTHSSGTWTLNGTQSTVADDFVVTGVGTVLNLDTSAVVRLMSGGTGADFTLRNGAVVNINAANAVQYTGSNYRLFVGQGADGADAILNLNANLESGRLIVGERNLTRVGIINGPGTLTVSSTADDGIQLLRGEVNANLASVATTGFNKLGPGTVTLRGDNSGLAHTGATRISEGTLVLDYTLSNTTKIRAASALDMRGGSLVLNGHNTANTSQTVASTTLATGFGNSRIVLNQGTGSNGVVLNLGAITRTVNSRSGTLRIVLPSGVQGATNGVTTTTDLTNGLVGTAGYITVEDSTGTWFATKDGNNIVALASTAKNDVASWLPGDHITDETTGFSGAYSNVGINSLRFDAAVGSVVNLGVTGVLGIATGGILVTDNVAGTPGILGGTLFSGAQASNVPELIVTHDGSTVFEIGADIRTNSALIKSGTGTLLLSGNNVTTGDLTIQNGVLQLAGGNAIGDTSRVTLTTLRNTTLQLLADETIGRLEGGQRVAGSDWGVVDVGIHSLTINQTGGNTTYDGIFAGSGTVTKIGNSTLTLRGNDSAGVFTGDFRVEQGLVVLSSTGTPFQGVSGITLTGSTSSLRFDNDQTTAVGSRIRDVAIITLNSTAGTTADALGFHMRRTAGTTSVGTETVGQLILNSGHNTVAAEGSATDRIARILFSNATPLVRNNYSTLFVVARNMNATAGQRGRISFSVDPGGAIGGNGTAGSSTINILPYMVGEDTSNAPSGATNFGNSFVRYESGTTDLRPLNLTSEYVNNEAAYNALGLGTLTNNVRFTATPGATLDSDTTGINALILDHATGITVTGPAQAIGITSGAILSAGAGANVINGFTALTTGVGNPYYIYVTNPAGTLTLATTSLTSSEALVKSGAGTLVLGAINSVSSVYLNQGILEIGDLDHIGGTTGDLVFAGGTLRLGAGFGDDLSTRTISFLLGGGTLDTNGIDLILSNSLGSGAGGFTKTGTGNLTLNAAATYTGNTLLSLGSITIGASDALGIGGDLSLAAGTTLTLGTSSLTHGLVSTAGAGTTITGTGTITASTGFSFSNTDATQVNAILAGSGGLFKNQTNTLTLAGLSTYTGTTEVQNGILSINSISDVNGGASALGNAADAESGVIRMGLTTTATTLQYTGNGHTSDRLIGMQGTTGGVTIDADGTGALGLGGARFENAGDKTLTLQGSSAAGFVNSIGELKEIGGVLSVVKSDANTWNLTSANTYSGTTTINAGVLRVSNNLALGTGGTTLANTGATLELNDGVNIGNTLTISDVGNNKTLRLLDSANTGTYSGNIVIQETTAGNFDIAADTGDTLTISGEISGAVAGGVSKEGAGTVVLTNANTFTGVTAVNDGILNIQNNAALGDTAGGTSVASGATIQLQGGITVGAEALTINGAGETGQSGALVNLSGDNTYGGAVTLGSDSTISSDAGLLTLNAATAVSGGGNDLTVAGAGNVTVSGVITDVTSFTKEGNGTVILSGNNNYTGPTDVNDGTLLINGASPDATGLITVGSGATLGGTGSAGGLSSSAVIESGGILTGGVDGNGSAPSPTAGGMITEPGAVGTLTFGGDLTVNSGSIWLVDLVQGAVTSNSDKIKVDGALTIGTNAFIAFNFDQSFANNGNVYTIAEYGSRDTNEFFTLFGEIDPWLSGQERSIGGGQYMITYGGASNGSITLTAVPEPGTFALLGLALAGFFFRRIRKRRTDAAASAQVG